MGTLSPRHLNVTAVCEVDAPPTHTQTHTTFGPSDVVFCSCVAQLVAEGVQWRFTPHTILHLSPFFKFLNQIISRFHMLLAK